MLDFLKGKKTYIVVIVGVLANGAIAMGLIDPKYLEIINTVLAFLGLGTLRAGISKK